MYYALRIIITFKRINVLYVYDKIFDNRQLERCTALEP